MFTLISLTVADRASDLLYFSVFLTPAPKAGVIVVACAVRAAAAAAGINLVGVPQTKPIQ